MTRRCLALFDLDHTLIPCDSGMAWLNFLADRGAVPADVPDRYLHACRLYVAGKFPLSALHRFAMAPLARHPVAEHDAWLKEFAVQAGQAIPASARALVAGHQAAGALCCIVTTTNTFIAAAFAEALGVALLASPAEIGGRLCHGEEKVRRVEEWLDGLGWQLNDFDHSVFYSDSASDLPLLEWVDEAVAVRPDAVLRRVAGERGWRIAEDLADTLVGLSRGADRMAAA